MIPILYDVGESLFLTNGLGRLVDAVSCNVDTARNGVFDLEMVYPMTGARFDDLTVGKIIYSRHADSTDLQPFRIYRISRPLSGNVTIYARHISRDLSKITIMPFTASGIKNTFAAIPANTVVQCPFTFWTDKTTANEYTLTRPMSVMAMLGGVEGSVLDVFGGGDYEFDGWTVKLHDRRGTDNGVTIRYGKNLTDLTKTADSENEYNGVVPFYQDAATGELLLLPEWMINIGGSAAIGGTYTNEAGETYTNQSESQYTAVYSPTKVIPLDLSEEWETMPTIEQLRSRAQTYIANNAKVAPEESLKVSFVQLWQTTEYENYAPLQRVGMGDTVHVYYSALGVDVATRVTRTVYDVLNERYNTVELGTASYTMSDAIKSISATISGSAIKAAAAQASSAARSLVEAQTALITGQIGGYFVIDTDEAGTPIGWLLMDTPDKTTARNVIRANQSGIGFSANGYNGPFVSAWTIDGKFNADFIQTGTLNADLITTGGMSAARITSGTIDAARLNLTEYAKFTDLSTAGSTTINGGNITTGTLSANRIKAGILTDEAGNFSLNMETGELSMQNGTFTGTVGSSLLSAIGAVYLQNGRIITYEGPDLETVLNTELVSDWPWYGYVITNEGGSLGGYEWRLDNSTILMVTKRQPIKLTPCLSMQGDITLTGTLSGSVSETQTGSYNGLTIVLYKNAGCVTCYIRGTTTEAMATGSAYVTLYTPANASWMPAERMVSYQQLTATYRGQVNPTTTGIQLGYTRNSSNTVADIPAGTPIYCMLTWAAK